MTRNESLDPILQPWMERNAPAAPQDLLPRVMREVDTVSQRTTAWPRMFFAAHPAWVLATAAAAILAVSLGAFLLSSGTRPVGGRATPAPNDGARAPAAEVIDASLHAFNTHDSSTVPRLFRPDATYRTAMGWPDWDSTLGGGFLDGVDQIKQEFATHATPDAILRHGSVLENGPYAVSSVSWTVTARGFQTADIEGSGFGIWHLEGSKVQSQMLITIGGIPSTEPDAVAASSDTNRIVDDVLRVWNDGKAGAVPTVYTATAQARFAVGSADWTAVYETPRAIQSAVTDVGVAHGTLVRTGAVVRYGRMVVFAATLTQDDHTAKVFVILELNLPETAVLSQWVIGG